MEQPIPKWLILKITREIKALEESQQVWHDEEVQGRINALKWMLPTQTKP